MSIWHEIKKQEDVELSEGGKTLDVCYDNDQNGSNYIEIPIEFVRCVFIDFFEQMEADELTQNKEWWLDRVDEFMETKKGI